MAGSLQAIELLCYRDRNGLVLIHVIFCRFMHISVFGWKQICQLFGSVYESLGPYWSHGAHASLPMAGSRGGAHDLTTPNPKLATIDSTLLYAYPGGAKDSFIAYWQNTY